MGADMTRQRLATCSTSPARHVRGCTYEGDVPRSHVSYTHHTQGTRAAAPHTTLRRPAAARAGPAPDSLTHKNTAEPPNFGRANPREGSRERRGPARHLARAGGGPRTGLDSRPPAARLSLQYGRYSLPR